MKRGLAAWAGWIGLAAVLNGLWELAQLPLYALWRDPDRWQVAGYVAHCTAGDVLIAAGLFVIAAAAVRDLRWPWRHPWGGGWVAVTAGVLYAAFSEGRNLKAGAWAYRPAMPTVGGIGLTPMLQWLVVPSAMIILLRWMARTGRGDRLSGPGPKIDLNQRPG